MRHGTESDIAQLAPFGAHNRRPQMTRIRRDGTGATRNTNRVAARKRPRVRDLEEEEECHGDDPLVLDEEQVGDDGIDM